LYKDQEDDYSYAYDCSVSPAFLIKWNGEMEQAYARECDDDIISKGENIYEEIDKRMDDEETDSIVEKEHSDGDSSRKSSSLNSDSGIGESHKETPHPKSYRRIATKLGTLDVTQRGPYKKRDPNFKPSTPPPIPVCNGDAPHQSSLDELLSR